LNVNNSNSTAAADFAAKTRQILDRIQTTQLGAIEQSARLMADTVQRDGIIYTFGSGHSHATAMEFYYRAGGLACCDIIHDKTFGRAERLSGYAAPLLDAYPVRAGDLLIVISNSGRNPLPVEMAMHAREHGLKVVALTSLSHSRSVTSRQPDGKRLFEVADVVIDNCGEAGDAAVDVGGGLRVGSTSSVAGAFIAQLLVCVTAEELLRRGIQPPVLMSMNLDGGDSHNQALLDRYHDRIRGL
jgi:uncharacterized phosphosugar-binding protein